MLILTDATYIVLSKNDVRNQMLWGNYISYSDFETCFSLVINHETLRGYFIPINNGESILIGNWMFDFDLSIIEQAKGVAFDCSKASKLGEGSNFFGKDVFERVVRHRLCDFGWHVVDTSIKLKQNKNTITDVDLIGFKNGVVIVGQLKVADCRRSDYQIWKTKQTIRQAVEQTKLSVEILNQNSNLLYSILKKSGTNLRKEEIKEVVPVVVTSSNYFIGLNEGSDVTVIGFDMLCEIMYYAHDDENNVLTIQSLKNPASLYSFSVPAEMIVSEIDQDEFHIFYEEYEI